MSSQYPLLILNRNPLYNLCDQSSHISFNNNKASLRVGLGNFRILDFLSFNKRQFPQRSPYFAHNFSVIFESVQVEFWTFLQYTDVSGFGGNISNTQFLNSLLDYTIPASDALEFMEKYLLYLPTTFSINSIMGQLSMIDHSQSCFRFHYASLLTKFVQEAQNGENTGARLQLKYCICWQITELSIITCSSFSAPNLS